MKMNLVVKAKKDVVFLQIGACGEGMCDVSEGFAKKDNIILISCCEKKYIPESDFEILGEVKVKDDADICPCCVSTTDFFDVSNYPDIVHINKLTRKSLGWRSEKWVEENPLPILRGLDMVKS